MVRIIECVPNFSEGRNQFIIDAIGNEISQINGVALLDTDSGYDANRTVYTFAGTPEQVIEAAFFAIKKAVELIDMSVQKGAHPRIGACDVCPLIPISGVEMKEVIELSKKLSERIANELNIPVYLYENSQTNKSRSNLATIRKGEYEGLEKKMLSSEWQPDYGNTVFNKKSGATVIGARDFLIAYNVNLNTKSVEIANELASEIRESGRVKIDPNSGEVVRDSKGKPIRIKGTLKHVKAIGWYMESFGIAQVSYNLINFRKTPIHTVFEETKSKSIERGVKVTGSELIGLIPLDALLMAGEYYVKKNNIIQSQTTLQLIELAIKELGLDELERFDANKRIIEYALGLKLN